jgi:hypothetical protein
MGLSHTDLRKASFLQEVTFVTIGSVALSISLISIPKTPDMLGLEKWRKDIPFPPQSHADQ